MLDPRRFKGTKIVLFAILLAVVVGFVAALMLGGLGTGQQGSAAAAWKAVSALPVQQKDRPR